MRPFLPPSIRHFDPPHEATEPKLETMSFVYDLVHALSARTIVDLAPGDVWTFRAACRSLRDYEIDGTAYGFANWPTAEGLSFNEANSHLRLHYVGLTCIVTADPGPSHVNFQPGSVDLLMLGPTAPALDERELVEWLARVSPSGAVVMRDRNEGTAAAAWSLLGARPEFVRFELSKAGVAMRREAARDMQLLQAIVDPTQHELLRSLYAHVAKHLVLRCEANQEELRARMTTS